MRKLIIIFLLFCAIVGRSAIVRVQSLYTYPVTSGTSYSFGTNTAGNLIVVCVLGLTAITGTTSVAVTDTRGNVYTALTAAWNQTIHDSYSQIWYAYNIKAGANSIIVTSSYFGDVAFEAIEYSGVKSSADPLDVTMTPMFALGNNTKTLTSNSFSPHIASLIVFAYMNDNVDPGTTLCTDGIIIFHYGSTHYDLVGDDLSAASASQTFSLAFTNSMGSTKYYAMVCACFLAGTTVAVSKINGVTRSGISKINTITQSTGISKVNGVIDN